MSEQTAHLLELGAWVFLAAGIAYFKYLRFENP